MQLGEIFAMGKNGNGQLGLGDKLNRNHPVLVPWSGGTPVKIATGKSHSLLLDSNGDVFAAGSVDL